MAMRRQRLGIFVLSLFFAGCLSAALPIRVTPINPAEAVIAPFWDGTLREKDNWDIRTGKIENVFGSASINWSSNHQQGDVVFAMESIRTFSCANYDTLLVFMRIPQGETLKMTLNTDKGMLEKTWLGESPVRDEYLMPLDGAQQIDRMLLEILRTGTGQGTNGGILWIGLQNSQRLPMVLEQIRQLAAQPLDLFLAPGNPSPAFKSRTGLLGKDEQLALIQEEYQQLKKAAGGRELIDEDIRNYDPAALLGETLPFANQQLFGRVRDDGRSYKSTLGLVQKALISKNAALMRMAVKNALIFALTPNWDTSFLSDFPDSGWEQRVFSNAVAAEAVAVVLDYADDLLSPAGKNLLLRRLSVDGLGQTNFNIWKHRYLFGNNQLAVFTRGRIAAYLTLEHAHYWNGERVKPYTELALQELYDSIDLLIHPDGSFLEGPGYFFYTISSIQPVLQMYANVRNKNLREIIPEKMKLLGAFADTLVSTDRRGGLIPFSSGQGEGRFGGINTIQFLAAVAPNSQWTTMYHTLLREKFADRLIADPGFWILRSQIPENDPPLKPFSELPVMGAMSSTRFINNSAVKILMLGTKANSHCHRHNDRGSFVLEFDGDTYAADPGGQNYADIVAKDVVRADYHNMLVPMQPRENEKETVSPVDIRPIGSGDATSFRAEFHPAPASNGDFVEWKRVIESPVPQKFIITDSYQTSPAHRGVRFLWITQLPWKQADGNTIRLDGESSYALIHYPEDVRFSEEKLLVRRKENYTRLNFAREGASGTIRMEVELFLKP